MNDLSKNRRNVYFFERPGVKNTEDVISAITERLREGGIEAVVVASVSGRTAVKIAVTLEKRRLQTRVICVSGPSSWKKYAPQYKFPLISERVRNRLDGLRVKILDSVEEPFRRIMFHDWWEKKTLLVRRPESDLFWMTLINVGGHGFRTAIEVVFMAVEAGALESGLRAIGVAGTGHGVDAAIVLKAARFDDAVGRDPAKRLKVEEILAMPKQTTWREYG